MQLGLAVPAVPSRSDSLAADLASLGEVLEPPFGRPAVVVVDDLGSLTGPDEPVSHVFRVCHALLFADHPAAFTDSSIVRNADEDHGEVVRLIGGFGLGYVAFHEDDTVHAVIPDRPHKWRPMSRLRRYTFVPARRRHLTGDSFEATDVDVRLRSADRERRRRRRAVTAIGWLARPHRIVIVPRDRRGGSAPGSRRIDGEVRQTLIDKYDVRRAEGLGQTKAVEAAASDAHVSVRTAWRIVKDLPKDLSEGDETPFD